MPGQWLRWSQWLAWGLMALIVIGCAGVRTDQPVTPTASPPSPTLTAPLPSPTPTPKEVASGPHIVFKQEAFDLGDLPVDQMFMLHFVYRNTGDAPLILEGEPQVETLEGC